MRTLHYVISIILFCMVSIACASKGINAANASTFPQFVDISINGIFLKDPTSSINVLGKIGALNTKKTLPSVLYTNKKHSEVLELVFHPGDIRNSFSEFRVTAPNAQETVELEGVEQFVSGKGIRLGISESDVIRILGKPHNTETHGNVVFIEYRLEGISESDFLQSYNMPIYYGRYTFDGDSLVEFLFGFEYP